MKYVYWFKPHRHFNVTTKEVYDYLQRFFDVECFKVTEEE